MGSDYGGAAPANSESDDRRGGGGQGGGRGGGGRGERIGGGRGSGVDSRGEGVRTGKGEWKRNQPLFVQKVKRLLKIWGAIKFPVNPIPHLSPAGKRGLLREGRVFSCLEDVCTMCDGPYSALRNLTATALIPVREVNWIVCCCLVGVCI